MINPINSVNSDFPRGFESLNARVTAESKVTAQKYIENIEAEKELSSKQQKVDESNKVDYKELETEIRNIIRDNNIAIEFAIDNDTKKMIMKIIDEETQETVKQFPSEISLQIARFLTQALDSGQITNAKV